MSNEPSTIFDFPADVSSQIPSGPATTNESMSGDPVGEIDVVVVACAMVLDESGSGEVVAEAGMVVGVKLTTGVVDTVGAGSSWKISTATSPTITMPTNAARPINQSVPRSSLPSGMSGIGGMSGNDGGDHWGVARSDGSIDGAGWPVGRTRSHESSERLPPLLMSEP